MADRADTSPAPTAPVRDTSAGAPIACVDLNGVLDTFGGWIDASHFDPPREGAREFLAALRSRGFRTVIFTTRYADDVWGWLKTYNLAALVDEVTDRKPPAFVFVDDRAVCFRGDFAATLDAIDTFAAHWEKRADLSSDPPRHD
jgi:hypothetical protein